MTFWESRFRLRKRQCLWYETIWLFVKLCKTKKRWWQLNKKTQTIWKIETHLCQWKKCKNDFSRKQTISIWKNFNVFFWFVFDENRKFNTNEKMFVNKYLMLFLCHCVEIWKWKQNNLNENEINNFHFDWKITWLWFDSINRHNICNENDFYFWKQKCYTNIDNSLWKRWQFKEKNTDELMMMKMIFVQCKKIIVSTLLRKCMTLWQWNEFKQWNANQCEKILFFNRKLNVTWENHWNRQFFFRCIAICKRFNVQFFNECFNEFIFCVFVIK